MPEGLPPQVQVQPTRKPWWKSRTLWFNLVMTAASAAEANLNVVQPLLPVNVFQLAGFVLAVGNALLRLVTTTALHNGSDA